MNQCFLDTDWIIVPSCRRNVIKTCGAALESGAPPVCHHGLKECTANLDTVLHLRPFRLFKLSSPEVNRGSLENLNYGSTRQATYTAKAAMEGTSSDLEQLRPLKTLSFM